MKRISIYSIESDEHISPYGKKIKILELRKRSRDSFNKKNYGKFMFNIKELIKTNNLRKIREDKSISRRILAMGCGQDISQVRRYEIGESLPSFPVIRKLTEFLDVKIEEIYPELIEKIDDDTHRVKDILLRPLLEINLPKKS